MTNEELAVKIKAGETTLMGELWSQVERFAYKQAYKFFSAYKDRCIQLGLELEDLYQESYIAIHKAVQGFDLDKDCTFLTYAGYHLKRQYFDAAKMHSTGWQKNTTHLAKSLDEPICFDDNETTLLDTLVDEADVETTVIEQVYTEQVKQDLKEAMTVLTDKQAYIIKRRYLDEVRPVDIARELGIGRMAVNNTHTTAIKKLKADTRLDAYRFCA